jgi:hypothetical protein
VFQNRLTDIRLLGDLQTELAEAAQLNLEMQAFFLRWYGISARPNAAVLFDQQDLDWFVAMNTTLHDTLDDAGVRDRLRRNVDLMRNLAATIVARAQAACPAVETGMLPSRASAETTLFATAA